MHRIAMPVLILILIAAVLPAADNRGFRKDVQPFLRKHCAQCHSAKAKVANLDVERFKSAESVLAEQDVWDKIVRKVRAGEMPPKPLPAPSAPEVKAVLDWLHAEYSRFDQGGKHDPGRITARRLNRAEYNNTIRDLTGLDLRPADQFPPDDSGYGFDNIGDVLSLSPALMEKYLNAAMRVTREAVASPRTYRETSDRYRSDRVKHNGPPGSIEVKHNFPVEADYSIRIAIAGRRGTEEEGLQVIAYFDGKMEKSLPEFVPATRPRLLDVKVRTNAGPHTMRALIVDKSGNPVTFDEKGPMVEYLEVRGPQNPAPFAPPPSHKVILTCGEWPGRYDDACVKQIVSNFARRAFRRPVTEQEAEKFYQYAKSAKDDGESAEQAIRYALQAVLVSPHFLFRIERDAKPNDAAAAHTVSEFELASRLSYFLWSSMPDEQLFDLALKNQLRKPGVLEQQVERMIRDARFAAFVDNFAGQWLELRNIDEVKPAAEKFPNFDNELRAAMKKETQLFFESVVRDGRSLTTLLDARYTFLNERLARHYGISGVTGPEFRKVELNTPQRGGVLTHASVLTVSSYPNRTSPVIRGKFVLENFLNAPPPPPPPNVPTLEESAAGMTGTLRQQMEKHRTNPTCAACHVRMDALGFGLENYDAIGGWRDQDGGQPIDASGALPGGREFRTPAELKTMLTKNQDDFAGCVTEKMMTYALGRGLEKNDRTFVRQIVRNLAATDYQLQRLFIEIARSAPFQMRRGEAARR